MKGSGSSNILRLAALFAPSMFAGLNNHFSLLQCLLIECGVSEVLCPSFTFIKLQCVVPENIHTPTTEGILNSRGVGWGGGSKAQEIPEETGGWR